MTWPVVTVATVAIIMLSAFFVAVEFALMAAKRHRLEDAATGSASARAALRSSAELTLVLAGSQLGITICTLLLGAVTKPAVHHGLTPAVASLGLPQTVADIASFLLALMIVTFLHLVVGEMAPKSWAIAHPERSATVLAIPMRAFMALTRPALRLLNISANWLVRRAGVEPVDELTITQDPEGLRSLVEHSANVGALDVAYRHSIESALDLQQLTLGDAASVKGTLAAVEAGASASAVQDVTRRSGHLRVLVTTDGRITGVVHVRDTLTLASDESIEAVTQEPLVLAPSMPLPEALATMRATRQHVVIVTDAAETLAVATLDDILARLLPARAHR